MKDKIIRLTKILISLVLMIFLIRKIDYKEFTNILGKTSVLGVSVVVSAYVASVVINAIKWRVLLPDTEINFLIALCFRAQFYSTVLPGQLFGEASKLTAWKNRKEDTAKVAASVIFDKITAMVGQIIIGVFGIYLSKKAIVITNKWVIVVLLITGISCIILSVNSHIAAGIRRSIQMIGHVHESLTTKLLEIFDSWVFFSSDRMILLKSIVWGIMNQLLGIFAEWYLAKQMGLQVAFVDFCWMILLMSILLLLPVTFAGIGLRDTSLASMLSVFNVSTGSSLILSLSILLGQLVAAGIGGIYILKSNLITNRKGG